MFEESVNQSSPQFLKCPLPNTTTEDFTLTVNCYAFYAIWIGFSILLLTWIILAVIVATHGKTS